MKETYFQEPLEGIYSKGSICLQVSECLNQRWKMLPILRTQFAENYLSHRNYLEISYIIHRFLHVLQVMMQSLPFFVLKLQSLCNFSGRFDQKSSSLAEHFGIQNTGSQKGKYFFHLCYQEAHEKGSQNYTLFPTFLLMLQMC